MDVETARGFLRRRGIELASDDSLLTFLLLNDVVLKGVLNPLVAADVGEIQSILRGKGIRISNDDPIFTLLALNSIVLHNSIDLVRRAQARSGSWSRPATYLKVLLSAALAFGVGVLIGMNQIETSRIFVAAIGCVLGIALGALGVVLIGKPDLQ